MQRPAGVCSPACRRLVQTHLCHVGPAVVDEEAPPCHRTRTLRHADSGGWRRSHGPRSRVRSRGGLRARAAFCVADLESSALMTSLSPAAWSKRQPSNEAVLRLTRVLPPCASGRCLLQLTVRCQASCRRPPAGSFFEKSTRRSFAEGLRSRGGASDSASFFTMSD